ncbi:Hsp20/alpha crystallin family protein [candidate division CSSED10-310 bacterium]|uniref:Hsp20/alpha crystallin family protein n=1 Tax=candidate division CSSED10-310 bacterium TaxID=2855610 RepID=A0ABV6YU25_UNCC1
MEWPIFERGINIWDPWRDIKQVKSEMDRILHRYAPERSVSAAEFPAINIWSNDETAIVTTEIAGIDPDDLDISVQGEQMTIRGSRGGYECTEGEIYHRRERGFGDFVRTIGLPFGVDADKVEAEYKKGVLTVSLPRAEHEKPKKISLKS